MKCIAALALLAAPALAFMPPAPMVQRYVHPSGKALWGGRAGNGIFTPPEPESAPLTFTPHRNRKQLGGGDVGAA